MPAHARDLNSLESLARRCRSRTLLSVSFVRAHRFVAHLEPSGDAALDSFDALPAAFRAWRQALRLGDLEMSLDALESACGLIETCRQQVASRDRGIEAFRVRWACENAPLRHQTIDALARFYRTLPPSSASQSKYEYVLTRRLAGPLRPDRTLPPTTELADAVTTLESLWGASTVDVEESERETLTLALASFAREAQGKADAASFAASALLRRFGAFKAAMGERLFDVRLSVAAVEANVAVLNAWSRLLADVGGPPLRSKGPRRQSGPIPTHLPLPVASGGTPPEPATESSSGSGGALAEGGDRSDLRTGEVDVSGLEFVRSRRKAEALKPAVVASAGPASDSAPSAEPPATPGPVPEAPSAPEGSRADLRTGEVDLSGLEFVRRKRQPTPAPAVKPDSAASGGEAEESVPEGPETTGTDAEETPETEQQPSARAFELAKLPENAEIIGRYLRLPRSAEAFQLDLDVFLGSYDGSIPDTERVAADRRRALDLILTADDLICLRATQEGAPSPEHKAEVRQVANAMLLLRTSMRRDAPPHGGREMALLLYVSDHLLWERLRLEASLKRNPRRQKPKALPRRTTADLVALEAERIRGRHRLILVRAAGVAAALALMTGGLGSVVTQIPVDPDVQPVELTALPGPRVFDEARGLKTTLYVSATESWALLGQEQRRTLVRTLATYAGERGFDTVSILGPMGEPWASFAALEVTLHDEAIDLQGVRR